EMFMGYSIGLDDHYFKPGENDVLQEYLKAVDYLTINEENRLKIKVGELIEKSKNNEYIIKSKLQEKDEQLKAVNHQVNMMQSQMQALIITLNVVYTYQKNTLHVLFTCRIMIN